MTKKIPEGFMVMRKENISFNYYSNIRMLWSNYKFAD